MNLFRLQQGLPSAGVNSFEEMRRGAATIPVGGRTKASPGAAAALRL